MSFYLAICGNFHPSQVIREATTNTEYYCISLIIVKETNRLLKRHEPSADLSYANFSNQAYVNEAFDGNKYDVQKETSH